MHQAFVANWSACGCIWKAYSYNKTCVFLIKVFVALLVSFVEQVRTFVALLMPSLTLLWTSLLKTFGALLRTFVPLIRTFVALLRTLMPLFRRLWHYSERLWRCSTWLWHVTFIVLGDFSDAVVGSKRAGYVSLLIFLRQGLLRALFLTQKTDDWSFLFQRRVLPMWLSKQIMDEDKRFGLNGQSTSGNCTW